MKDRFCLLTTDVETTSIWFNQLRDETGLKVFKEGMPILLELYEKYNIKSTFYFTGYIAKLIPDIVRMVIPYGHEVGSHSFSHRKEDGLDQLLYKHQLEQLISSKKILEDIIGDEVISFRAPALRLGRNSVQSLIESGYKIDSSVASQRFDMFLSFGGLKKLNWLVAPRLPYITSDDSIFRKGNSGLIEVPLSATFLSYVGTTMRIFPLLTRIQHHLLNIETSITSKPIVFDIHPNELIDESSEKRVISRRSSNLLTFILKDLIRSKLKVKNLGLNALSLYEHEILFFKKRDYMFTTVRDYCQKTGLLKSQDSQIVKA